MEPMMERLLAEMKAKMMAKMDATDFQRTTRRYIPEDRGLRNHRCDDLKSYNILGVGSMRCPLRSLSRV
jgi:hypothetical protein